MNWKRLYALVQTTIVVWAASLLGAIFWGMLIAGVCRFVFRLNEQPAMLFIFCPVSLAIVIFLVWKLPPSLRKAGMLSDAPSKFGPCFKD